MKNILISLIIIVTCSTFAQTSKGPLKKATKQISPQRLAEIRAMKRARFERNSGGWIYRKEKDPGCFTFVNTQKRIPDSAFNETISTMQKFLCIDIKMESGQFEGTGKSGHIYMIDDIAKPGLVIVPEEGWGIVNVAKLGNNNLTERTLKELWRALAFVCGAANTDMPHCLMKPVFKPEDLDKLQTTTICPEPLMKMEQHLNKMGIKRFFKTTYLQACREGWAPAPTNDIQKAIWDKVHAAPKNPMKIEFDPKKGR